MRVTNQMLNQSASQAGRQVKSQSLLDYINADSGQNTLLSVLSKNGQSHTASAVQKQKYEKMEDAADKVLEQLSLLAGRDEDSLFAKAKAEGDTDALCQTIEKMIEKYNQAVRNLSAQTEALPRYYNTALKEAAAEDREALAKIGISLEKDGTITVDAEKLKTASADTLEKLFGNQGSFSVRTAYVLAQVSKYAYSSAESLSSQYNSAGGIYTQAAGKYDFRG